EPWYVVAKDSARNALIVAQGEDHAALLCHRVHTGPINWLGTPPKDREPLAVRLRYRQPDQPAVIETEADGLQITPQKPQRAVTPGQSAVIYVGSRCLGGGVIRRTDI